MDILQDICKAVDEYLSIGGKIECIDISKNLYDKLVSEICTNPVFDGIITEIYGNELRIHLVGFQDDIIYIQGNLLGRQHGINYQTKPVYQ